MTELEKFLDLYINEDLIRIIISGPRKKYRYALYC